MTNILLLSVGTRNKIVQYFKKTLRDKNGEKKGEVVATDMSKYAPALYEADKFYLVPRITDENYIDKILSICKEEKIDGVLSLIDPELELLAENKEKFDQLKVEIVSSPLEATKLAFDKMKMYRWLVENGYKAARSYSSKEDFCLDYERNLIDFPVFVKPVKGSASIAISKVYDMDVLDLLCKRDENLMIQEFLDGQEIGADVYIDLLTGEVVSIFTKKKILMRAGETDKAVSFKDENLFALIKEFVGNAGFRGQIDIDIFDIDGEYYISEVNPRFGGGYPHAYECGVDHMKLIVNNLENRKNKVHIGDYEENKYMMKYNEIKII